MRLLYIAIITTTCIGIGSRSFAQETASEQSPTTETPALTVAEADKEDVAKEGVTKEDADKPDRTAFDAVVAKWQKITSAYTTFAIDWHLSEPSAKDRELRIKWGEMLHEARQAYEEAMVEATKIVDQGLHYYPDVSVFLMQAVVYRSDKDWFELSGPAIIALLKHGKESDRLLREANVDREKLHAFAGLSFFMTGDFDNADKYLKLAAESDSLIEKYKGLPYVVDKTRENIEPEMKAREQDAAKELPRVKLNTSRGPIVIELFEDEAPGTVGNFINLVEQGFYDGNLFYQVVKGQMAMSGDPAGDGSGTAGYQIKDEYNLPNARAIARGSVLMAKLPDPTREDGALIPDSASSQFIIALAPFALKSSGMTAFGRVVEGMGTVVALNEVEAAQAGKKNQKAPDILYHAEVLRKRDHLYEPIKADSHAGHAHVH